MDNPNRPLPPLDLLRGFEAAARHLSFTRAAAELFLTQSAVSRQIQALEEYLGVPLFARRHKALTLTEAGHAYFRSVSTSLEQLREATRKARGAGGRQVLTVTTTVSFASIWLVPRLARFSRVHPGLDVRVSATHNVADIEREGIDIAVRDCPANAAPSGSIHLVSERLSAVCAPAYAREAKAKRRALAQPGDLRHHVMLYLHDPTGRWPWLSWRQWFESRGIDDLVPAGALTFDQYDQVMQAALHGQGVALGRMSVAEHYVRDKRLVALFGSRDADRGFHAILSRPAQARPEAHQFIEWLREEIKREK